MSPRVEKRKRERREKQAYGAEPRCQQTVVERGPGRGFRGKECGSLKCQETMFRFLSRIRKRDREEEKLCFLS